MREFFELEGAYIFIGLFILGITIFVTTRSFMSKNAFKIGVPTVTIIITFFISFHYYLTKTRMEEVRKAFLEGKNIVCENKMYAKTTPAIVINKKANWVLKGNILSSPEYERVFHIARCVVDIYGNNNE